MTMNRREIIQFAGALSLFSLAPSLTLASKSRSKFLILIELDGANDGLNTVVPYGSKLYKRLRPRLAIENKDILKLDNFVGLNPALQNIANLYEQGECKIVQGLGYPHPNLSHFRSIELWERGGDGKSNGGKGWLIEPLEVLSKDLSLDAKAMFLDNAGNIFSGGLNGYLSVQDLRLITSADVKPTEVKTSKSSNPLIGELIQSRDENRELLAGLKSKLGRFNGSTTSSDIGSQMKTVCDLIGKGLNIPVFKVSIGGFDTHESQFWTHKHLLEQLDRAVGQTATDLKRLGVWDDTIIMTYSEFGRRAKENGSEGTDHGMAAPHFLLGGGINGGIYGDYPQLGQLEKDNLLYSMDYRSVYNFVLSEHFGLKDNPFSTYDFSKMV